MKRQTKLNEREQEQHAAEQQVQAQAAVEFASVEDMLRHDARQTPVPPAVAERLRDSLETAGNPAAPVRSWWRRLLGS